MKASVVPTSKEALGAGVSLTMAGTTSFETWVGELELQEMRREQPSSPRINVAAEPRNANLPMNTFQKEVEQLFPENSQFRGSALFRQLAHGLL